jgi:hypothetical protein
MIRGPGAFDKHFAALQAGPYTASHIPSQLYFFGSGVSHAWGK